MINIAKKRYAEFIKEYGKEPTYAKCDVSFDDGSMMYVTIKLSCDYNEDEDDYVFFYCNGLNDFLSLYDEDSGQDFHISGIVSFDYEV